MPIRREKEEFMKRNKSEQWVEEEIICPDCDENQEFLPETEKKVRKKIQWTKKNITKEATNPAKYTVLLHSKSAFRIFCCSLSFIFLALKYP